MEQPVEIGFFAALCRLPTPLHIGTLDLRVGVRIRVRIRVRVRLRIRAKNRLVTVPVCRA